jgi:isoleucyl-tRNA synthetase
LGNIRDDYEKNCIENIDVSKLPNLEKYMLHKIYLINKNFHRYFKSYNFHNLYKELLNFCTVELSAFYFDIRKDLLYCDPIDSKKRSDCISVLNIILQSLLKWFAPILSFTSEEIYRSINKEEKENSIHLKNFVKIPENWKNEELNANWEKIKKIRDEANISIETQRTDKIIGSSLEANIQIKLKDELYKIAKNEDFSEICITSSASIIKDDKIKSDIQVNTQKAIGNKCPVCWKISENDCERHGHLKL